MSLARLLIAAAAFLAAVQVRGHDSPVHRIESLTKAIESDGASIERYLSRAYEYSALSQWSEATSDFKSALKAEPNSLEALYGLTTALIATEAFPEAKATAQRGIALSRSSKDKVPLLALLAKAQMGLEQWSDALLVWEEALQTDQAEIDWFLAQAECLKRLDRSDERATALRKAKERNPSVVLDRAWISALVDAGQTELALPEIDKRLSQARWKSAWLLLRAQVFRKQGRIADEQADAQRALTELSQRLDTKKPDPILLQEEARARAILKQPRK